jgi:hypothetical protein
MTRTLLDSVRRDVLNLCDSAVDSRAFMQAAGDLLSRAVPCDVWAMHAVDPLGVTDELRATFVSNASCWGVSTFLRTGTVPFTPADVRFIFSLAPHIGGALRRRAWVADAVKVPDFTPAIVVLDDRDRIVEATADAVEWLTELKLIGPRVDRTVPVVVSVIAQQARLQAPMPLAGGDFRRVRTIGGNWVSLRGARLKGSRARHERVAVVSGGRPVLAAGASAHANFATIGPPRKGAPTVGRITGR